MGGRREERNTGVKRAFEIGVLRFLGRGRRGKDGFGEG